MKGLNPDQNRQLRVDVHARFGGHCAYCGDRVRLREGTVDHYLPRALGGSNARRNLRWCCWACNQAKADMHPDEWEQRRPVLAPRRETKAEVRNRLLSEIARKGRALAPFQPKKEGATCAP